MVTGGAGYVGSHTCKALAQAGFLPIVLDNLIYGHEWAVKWGPSEIGDTADTAFVVEVIRNYQPIAVIHFAAFAYVGESVSSPEKYYKNNVCSTLALVEAMLQCEVGRLIFSSTCATYGIPLGKTIPEDSPQRPINPYGRSKLMVEQILRDYDRAYGFKSISLRYFNAAGADPDGEIGEQHDPETHLIPLVLDAASGRSPHISIYGTDYDTPDGTCVRDYIHVTDLADAHVRALRSLLEGAATDAFNLGVGTGYSVRQVIEAASAISGKKIGIVEGARRAGDPPYLVAEPGRARKHLGWQPALPKLDDIIRTAWLWHKKAAGLRSSSR
ncbi:MAG: UDP-glucose 4-epimerase GalE [Pseudomonadales bacterium]